MSPADRVALVEEEEEEPSVPLANSGNNYTQEGEGLAMDPKLQTILAKRRVAADEHSGKFILILTIWYRVSQRARK